MIFLFTWEEKFLLHQQLEKWKKAFIQKYPWSNLFSFWEENFDPEKIAVACAWWWLFDEKKFIIIKWIPKDSLTKIPSSQIEKLEKFFTEHIDNLPNENVIVFISYKPDKRTKFYKFLSQKAEVKEFKPLTEKQLIKFITANYKIKEPLAKYIIERLGTNLYLIHNEITKLLKFTTNITKENIDKYLIKNTQQDTFELLDNLDNSNKAIKILENLEKNQEDLFKVLWLLYWNLKNIILIKEQLSIGENSKNIASKLGIHPFVVNKIINKNYDLQKIRNIFWNILELDYSIKSGKIPLELWYLYLKKII